MAVVFVPLQQLNKNDLNIFIRDTNGNMFDPYNITFQITDSEGSSIFFPNELMTPQKESLGWYWANISIPSNAPVGSYIIKWKVQDFATSTLQEIEQRFGIVKQQASISFTPTIGGVVYYPNQTLSEKDLYVMIRNHLGNLSDPYMIHYEIYQRISGLDILISPQGQNPLRLGIGHYFANYVIPYDSIAGDYYIKWTFKDSPNGTDNIAIQEFAVVDGSTIIQSPYTTTASTLIRKLRFLLRDNNPDRNYHFMPPSQEEVIQGFTQKFGYVWEDEELYEYIDMAISEVNNYPPHEGWTIDTLISRLYSLVLTKAAVFGLQALAINWAHDEWDGSISGVSMSLEKSSKYLAIKENFVAAFQAAIAEHKEFGVRYIRGISQPRYGMGVTSALGPYSKTGVQSRRNYIGMDRSMFA